MTSKMTFGNVKPTMRWSWALWLLSSLASCEDLSNGNSGNNRYTIEGRAYPPDAPPPDWPVGLRVVAFDANAGELLGFVRPDGSFLISNAPSGSYAVEVLHPDYYYEPARVEINSKGKYRARKVNHLQTSLVVQVPYPLKTKALSKFKYFQQREQWRLADFLFNPMVLMMVLPLALIMILPKMMNDPETKKEMEQLSNFKKNYDLPEISEVIATFLSGEQPSKNNQKTAKNVKKRQ